MDSLSQLFSLPHNVLWLVGAVALAGLVVTCGRFLRTSPHHESEPPLISAPFPVFGHLYGMLRYGSHYYTKIRQRTGHDIYSLQVPGKKLYVVSSPELVQKVDHNSRAISFDPFVVLFLHRIIAPSDEAMHIVSQNLEGKGPAGFRQETMKTIHHNVAVGENVEHLTRGMLRSLIPQLQRTNGTQAFDRVDLFKWVKRVVSRASTDGIYGPYNPFHDDEIAESFWSVDSQFAYLGLNILPRWTARRGDIGRDNLSDAFFDYYSKNGHHYAANLVRARYEVDRKYGFGIKDTARFELSIVIGLLVNIVPTTFWCLYFIFQRPALLEELRAGLAECTTIEYDAVTGQASHHVDFAKVLTQFPLLSACIKEALRVLSTNAAGRVVMKDTWLDNRYLLKKGSMLMIPSAELHNEASIWGTDYSEFNPHRWLKDGGLRVPAAAYRAFGGGSWPCPGQKFSSNEMAAALVMIIMQYDLYPTQGHWGDIQGGFHISTSVRTPKEDIEVDCRCRKGYENVDWKFYWKGDMI